MSEERRVWDLPVRVFHWALLLAVAGAWCTHAAGVAWFRYHVWCGYTVLVLVAFRLLWGIVGTRQARFASFVRGPIATLRYAKQLARGTAPRTAGHNPLGAWMVLALLAALLAQALLGLFGNDEIFNFGPLYGYVSNARSIELTSLHRRLFYAILAAIVLHVAAVAWHRYARGENLVRPMFTGRKPAATVPAEQAIGSSRTGLALLIVAALAATLAWIVRHAPAPQDVGWFE
jgi:cytochrome b